jgi:hypothetical protein
MNEVGEAGERRRGKREQENACKLDGMALLGL